MKVSSGHEATAGGLRLHWDASGQLEAFELAGKAVAQPDGSRYFLNGQAGRPSAVYLAGGELDHTTSFSDGMLVARWRDGERLIVILEARAGGGRSAGGRLLVGPAARRSVLPDRQRVPVAGVPARPEDFVRRFPARRGPGLPAGYGRHMPALRPPGAPGKARLSHGQPRTHRGRMAVDVAVGAATAVPRAFHIARTPLPALRLRRRGVGGAPRVGRANAGLAAGGS